MECSCHIDIAGLSIGLHEVDDVLAALGTLYLEFDDRGDVFRADQRNCHLCMAGCSQCCRRGAVFAVTLAEAVRWSMAIKALSAAAQVRVRDEARRLLEQQRTVFAPAGGPADVPGKRDEALFSARVTKLNATGPACPLLSEDLCTVYNDRPMLCRAYGYPVDAYAVKGTDTLVFRSLCSFYEGVRLHDYVRAEDLKRRLTELSTRIGGGRDWGRFTSPEAILSVVRPAPSEVGAPSRVGPEMG